jgi:four helix bundle protein
MTSEIRSFRDLIAWQKAMDLCKQVYALSKRFPLEERFGLMVQVRRASVSIPSDIAEGYGRGRKQDYLRFLSIALGSLCEVETQLLLSVQLGFTDSDGVGPCMNLVCEVDRVLSALIRAVRESTPPGSE